MLFHLQLTPDKMMTDDDDNDDDTKSKHFM